MCVRVLDGNTVPQFPPNLSARLSLLSPLPLALLSMLVSTRLYLHLLAVSFCDTALLFKKRLLILTLLTLLSVTLPPFSLLLLARLTPPLNVWIELHRLFINLSLSLCRKVSVTTSYFQTCDLLNRVAPLELQKCLV